VERSAPTAWHPHHIAERYGHPTIIVLGESVSASTVAVQSAVDEHKALGALVHRRWRAVDRFLRLVDLLRRTHPRSSDVEPAGFRVGVRTLRRVHLGRRCRREPGDRRGAGGRYGRDLDARRRSGGSGPDGIFLFTVWGLHVRYSKRGMRQQLVLAVTAVAGLVCAGARHARCGSGSGREGSDPDCAEQGADRIGDRHGDPAPRRIADDGGTPAIRRGGRCPSRTPRAR
jgi:low temperature requirement A protein (LtrA)